MLRWFQLFHYLNNRLFYNHLEKNNYKLNIVLSNLKIIVIFFIHSIILTYQVSLLLFILLCSNYFNVNLKRIKKGIFKISLLFFYISSSLQILHGVYPSLIATFKAIDSKFLEYGHFS